MRLPPSCVNAPTGGGGDPPTLTSIDPVSNPESSNVQFTITGTGFTATSLVRVGALTTVPQLVPSDLPTTIVTGTFATNPSVGPAGVYDLTVANGSQVSNALPFTVTP